MKNIVGQPLNQLVGNGANSSGEGPTHLEKKINNNYYNGLSLPLTRLGQAQVISVWKTDSSSRK